jgi:hypothetical protein
MTVGCEISVGIAAPMLPGTSAQVKRRCKLAAMRTRAIGLVLAFACAAAAGCGRDPSSTDMNTLAERYVKLVLKVGQHDENFVDAYYGDPAWRPSGEKTPLEMLAIEARSIRDAVKSVPVERGEEIVRLRRTYLEKQINAVETRLAMLMGVKMSFDEEATRLYDATPPQTDAADLQPALDELERLLPGPGALVDRYATFRKRFEIPHGRLDAVFRAAIQGCRERTIAELPLPRGESFTVEYVTGKSWSAYNWYKGNFTSLIQVNTDLPITIDRALDLACHEGYPGHHVYNALLEQHLVRDRGWIEFTVYPLFSPQSLIAEGTANFGIEVAFPGEARTTFERDTLYPLAGLDPATAETYSAVQRATEKLSYAANAAARKYLNGEIDRTGAAAWLQRYGMMTHDRADQRVRFIDQYRSYVINYNLGQDLVRAYVDRRGGTADAPKARWKLFGDLLRTPRVASGLR